MEALSSSEELAELAALYGTTVAEQRQFVDQHRGFRAQDGDETKKEGVKTVQQIMDEFFVTSWNRPPISDTEDSIDAPVPPSMPLPSPPALAL